MMKFRILAVTSLVCLTLSEGSLNRENLPEHWKNIQEKLPEPWKLLLELTSVKPLTNETTPVTGCDVCQQLVPPLKLVAAIVPNFEAIREPIYEACRVILGEIDDGGDINRTCNSIDTQGPPILSVLKNSIATTEKICRNLNLCIEPLESRRKRSTTQHKRSSKVSKRKPKVNNRDSKVKTRKEGVIRFAQVADIHVDPEYAIGSPEDCGLLVCCRDHYEGTGSAGPYGAYSCNTPQRTLELFLQKVNDLNPDFVVHTGDNPTHHLWEESREESLQCSTIVYESLQRVFEDTLVYCSMGNHEAYPTNLYDPALEETQDLQNRFANWWGPLGNLDEEQKAEIQRNSMYQVSTNVNGLRVISINSNFWYVFNFYNILLEDSAEEQYYKANIRNQLEAARIQGEKVLLLLHHPQGNLDSIVQHSRWFRDLQAEFDDVILFGVSGHTHYDEFKLFRNPESGDPVSVVYIAPSMTPMSSSGGGVNPSMRLFTLDAETFELLEIEQYALDLSKIDNDNPNIELVYKFTEEYDLPDVTAPSMAEFVDRMVEDTEFFNKWWSSRNTRRPRDEECTGSCRIAQICYVDNVVFDEYLECISNAEAQNKMKLKEKDQVHPMPVAARYSEKLRKQLVKGN